MGLFLGSESLVLLIVQMGFLDYHVFLFDFLISF